MSFRENAPGFKRVTVDIETRAPDMSEKDRLELVKFKMPKTIKREDTKKKWIDDFLQGGKNYQALALDTEFAEIVSIACKVGYSETVCWVDDPELDGDPIDYFAMYMDKVVTTSPFIIIGHNVIGFDGPILWRHLKQHKYSALANVFRPRGKYKSKQYYDTMLEYPGERFHSLKMLALSHKWNTVEGFDGADVAHAWRAGRYDEIEEYNVNDVELTWKLYRFLELE